MGKYTKLIGRKMLALEAVGMDELDAAIQTEINQVATNKTDIANIIASKGAANGIATLGADGKLDATQIPQIAVSDFLGEVATEAAMLGLDGQRGDWAIRTDESKSYMLVGDDASVLANWKEIVSPEDGVTSLRNTSGSVTGQNGVVTLSDVAFSGAAADVAFSHADYTATNVDAALAEIMAKAKGHDTSITDINTELGGKVGMTGITPFLNLTGTINGTNKTFTSSVDLTGAKVLVRIGAGTVDPADYTVSGNDIVFNTESPDYEYDRPNVTIFKAA